MIYFGWFQVVTGAVLMLTTTLSMYILPPENIIFYAAPRYWLAVFVIVIGGACIQRGKSRGGE